MADMLLLQFTDTMLEKIDKLLSQLNGSCSAQQKTKKPKISGQFVNIIMINRQVVKIVVSCVDMISVSH